MARCPGGLVEGAKRAAMVAVTVTVVVAVVHPAEGGAQLGSPLTVRVAPPPGAVSFGASVAGVSDVDGDGVGDVGVGAPGSGQAFVVSGVTGTVLHKLAGLPPVGTGFGAAVAAIGDVDGDGVGDVGVGAPSGPGHGPGRAFLFSGASGALLRQLAPGSGNHPAFGHSLAGGGDLSGDAVPDIIVAAPAHSQGAGTVFAFSGADGRQLWSRMDPVPPPVSRNSFGETVVITPDMSGDGIAEMLVAASGRSDRGQPAASGDLLADTLTGVLNLVTKVVAPEAPGRVYVLSGLDGAVVRTISDPVPGGAFGATVGPIGDQDGDGVVDHLVGEGGTGQLHLYSGRAGGLMRSFAAPATVGAPGAITLASAGDWDGDGRGDAWVGIPSAHMAYLVNGEGGLLASPASPSPQGSFGAAMATVPNGFDGGPSAVVVSAPTEPGGGAAYLLRRDADAIRFARSDVGRSRCTGSACPDLLLVQAQTTTPTTVPPTTVPQTTVPPTAELPMTQTPANEAPSIAVLPKPASAAAAVNQDALADTGGTDRALTGLLACALGMAGLVVGRRRERSAGGAPRPRE